MQARQSHARRWLLLAACSFACGWLSAVAALMGHQWSLPPTDGAYGASPFVLLTDPSVQFVTAAVVFPASALGLIGARVFLWNTRFALTVPIVSAVSILVCLLGGRLSFFVIPVALLAALVAMAWCEERFPAKGVERRTRRSLRA